MRRPVSLLLLALGLLLLGVFRAELIGPPAVDPDHPFDTPAAVDRLSRILGDERPHPVDSDAGDAMIARLVDEARALGLSPTVWEGFHCNEGWQTACARVRNVKIWIGEPGPNAVLLASHHDSVPTGPGAADDGMGVTASLEIASRLQRRLERDGALPRPVLVLITDGEEIGLVGASAFVTRDPDARLVSAVVSLEARGNRGTATMFETSQPNGRDVAALGALSTGEHARLPLTNSMAVDIYRRMPNGTDVTEYLSLGIDALNFSMIGRYSDYHTRDDTVANLDPRSLFHNGASAMAVVDRLLDAGEAQATEAEVIYGDALRLVLLKVPASVALPLVALAPALSLVAAFRVRARALWRALALPPIAIVLALALAMGVSVAVTGLRPESAPGTAHPWALRGLQHAAALLGAVATSAWLFRPEQARAHLWSAAAWTFGLGALGSVFLPGLAFPFVFPALVALLALAFEALRRPGLATAALVTSVALHAALFLPAAAVAEAALFVESAGPFVLPVVLLWLWLHPALLGAKPPGRAAVSALAATTVVFTAAALLVPAYSAAQPLGRNIVHVEGDRLDASEYRTSAADPLPEGWGRLFGFARQGGVFRADAPPTGIPRPDVAITANRVEGAERIVGLRIRAPGTDRLVVRTTGEDRPVIRAVSLGGADVEGRTRQRFALRVHGRGAGAADLVLRLDAAETGPVEFSVTDVRYGLAGEGRAIDRARPPWTGPQHDGDQRFRGMVLTVPGLSP